MEQQGISSCKFQWLCLRFSKRKVSIPHDRSLWTLPRNWFPAIFMMALVIAGCGSGSSKKTTQPGASLTPSSYTFAIQTTNTTSAAQAFSLANTGDASLNIAGIGVSGTNAASFAVTSGNGSCANTLAPGATCTIYVTFSPAATGNYAATLNVNDNATPSSQTVSITGLGIVGNVAGQTPDTRADAMLSLMTQNEKLQMVMGGATEWWNYTVPRGAGYWVPAILRLNIPELVMADGPGGVGDSVGPATALPSSLAGAASWDLSQATKYGTVIGAELAGYGINVNLGGNINLTSREPRDGRTFETAGEDPILAGKTLAARIAAIQAQHVIAGLKHFALNDQETGRFTANAVIDDRGMRESDLLAFEIGVKDGSPQSVMCSYNQINGQYACENRHLLNDVLKAGWGFQGFVLSDALATHSTVDAANNGLDQEQPDQQYFSSLGAAITAGQVPQSRLDDMVHRVLRAMYAVGLFDIPQNIQAIPAAADAALAQEIEEHGAVLLKNNAAQLPLNGTTLKSIAVIGSHADVGVLSGGGSALVHPAGGAALNLPPDCPPNLVSPGGAACTATSLIYDPSSPVLAIKTKAPDATVVYNDGSDPTAAAAVAASSDVAIVFESQWESEGIDLPDLSFSHNQDALVSAVAAQNPRTVVVLENGGPQLMPWLASVSAVLEAWYPGQNGGTAIANILFGLVNPSGKLPVTFPASVADLPHPTIPAPDPVGSTTPFGVDYTVDGFNVGYKWYDSRGLAPLFPFGFGLSYTTFSMTDIAVGNNLDQRASPISR
jgi:beta-glucosidase